MIEHLEKGANKLFRIVFDRLDTLENELPILPKKRKNIDLKEEQ